MSQMPEDPNETRSWERKKREAEESAQMDEDTQETERWEQKKKDGGGVSA